MNKAVLISIRPKWCEKIANGEKTIEVRKTRPKMRTPFKCYIYCTKPEREHEDFIRTNYPKPQFYGGGKVIGEFTCDRIDWIIHVGYMGIPGLVETCICDAVTMRTSPIGGLLNAACLTSEMLNDYIARGDGYGWHITNLRIYDAPKSMSEFWAERLDTHNPNAVICVGHQKGEKRAPQSWRYVPEVEK